MSRHPSSPNGPRPRPPANGPATPYANARITTERVEMSLRSRFDPLPSLSPPRLVQYLQQFHLGYLDLAARTWHAMERRDDRLASVSAKAKSALARYGFEVCVRPNLPLALREEAARHQAALEHLYTHCTVTNAVQEDEQGGFSLLVRQMADAIGKKYSVHEILWEPGAAGSLTATFRHAPLWFFEATTGKLRYKPEDGAATGVDLDPDAWLVTVGDGIMEACSVLWVYKHLPLRDWLAYSEKFGLPYLLGKTQALCNSQEWLAMVAALRGFGSDGAAVVGGTDDIVPVQVGSGSEATPFPGLVERSERAMSILWRGADLGTQAHSGQGQGQGASLQGDETAALDEDRAAWLGESLARVSRTAIRYLFGEGVQPLAYVRLKTPGRQDVALDLAVDTFLLNSGAPVAVADVLARYHRPTPAAGEPLLRPPGGANGGGGGGAKGVTRAEATLASLERAANAEMACMAAGNFNPYHDKRGRFTTSDGADAGDGTGGKATPKPGSTDDDQDPSSQPEDVSGSSKSQPRTDISPALSLILRLIKGAVSPLGPIIRTLGLEGQDKQPEGMQDLIDQLTGGITTMARANGNPDEEKRVVQGFKDQVTTPEGIGSLISTALLGKLLSGKVGSAETKVPMRPREPAPIFSSDLPDRPGEPEPGRAGRKAKSDVPSDEPKADTGLVGGYAADRNSIGSHLHFVFSSKINKIMAEALDAIHSAHRDGGLKGKLSVFTGTALLQDAEGLYARNRNDLTKAVRIEIKEDAATPAFTTVSEIGHWLHHQAFSRWGNEKWSGEYSALADNESTVTSLQRDMAASQAKGEAIPEITREHLRTAQAMADLQRTLESTPEIKALRKVGKIGEHSEDAAYLRKNEEIFSRAYAQYIAQKSQNPRLLTDLEMRRNSPRSRNTNIRAYWSDENFRPVASKFDALLQAKGWLNEP